MKSNGRVRFETDLKNGRATAEKRFFHSRSKMSSAEAEETKTTVPPPLVPKAVPQLSPVLLTVLNASTDAVVITDIDATIVSVRFFFKTRSGLFLFFTFTFIFIFSKKGE
jgi:hypothetical protein